MCLNINNNNNKILYTFSDCILNDFYNVLYYFEIYNNIKFISFIEHLDLIKQLNYKYIIDEFIIIILDN